MTADELRELAGTLDDVSEISLESRNAAATYLRACAEALDAGPVAWTLQETLDKRETTHRAYLWFVDPQNSAWAALYPVALPGSLRLPEPMTESDLTAMSALHDTCDPFGFARAIEAETLRRVKEANK